MRNNKLEMNELKDNLVTNSIYWRLFPDGTARDYEVTETQ